MIALPRHAAGWCWRFFGFLLALRLVEFLGNAAGAIEHHPVEGSIVTGALLLLMLGVVSLFWRRGGQLIEPEIPWLLALFWVPLRTAVEAVSLAFFAIGLCIVLLQLFGGELAQASMLQVSFAHNLTDHPGWSPLVNWTLHCCVPAFFYGAGLRFNDLLKRLTEDQDLESRHPL